MKKMKNIILTGIAAMLSLCINTTKVMSQEIKEAPIDTLARGVHKLTDEIGLLKKIKLSGYVQAQFQWADSMGAKSYAGGDFPTTVDKRFRVRRGEFKIMYDNVRTQVVANIDVNQNGISIKDAYGKFTEQKLQAFSLSVGIFSRPFGFECPYSSGLLETPERSRVVQVLFPGERDLGAMLTFQMPKTSRLNPLKIEAGMFNGTGNNVNDFDYYKDFIGNIHWNAANKSEKIKYGIGASFYYGGSRQGTTKVYEIDSDSLGLSAFKMTNKQENLGAIAKRQYIGFDAQVSIDFPFGITTLRGEFIMGQQPATSSSTTSLSAQPTDAPVTTYTSTSVSTLDTLTNLVTTTTTTKATTTTANSDMYIRQFSGANFYLIQNIWKSKHALVVKYDWYDPNTKVGGDDIGSSTLNLNGTTFLKTNSSDLKFTTLGIGWIYRLDNNVKFTLYYDMVMNEKSKYLPTGGYWKDVKDNVLTIRCQYKF